MASEQREYIRIKDKAIIRLSFLSEKPLINNEFPLPLPPHFKLLNQIVAAEAEEGNLLHAIEADSSSTAKYFKIVNAKIESLAKLILASHPESNKYPEQNVSISETGIDFYHSNPASVGSFVAINMIFLPNYLSFEVYAKVITCEPIEDNELNLDPMYRYGLQFVNIEEHDRDKIARRIFHKQLEERRKQRLGQ